MGKRGKDIFNTHYLIYMDWFKIDLEFVNNFSSSLFSPLDGNVLEGHCPKRNVGGKEGKIILYPFHYLHIEGLVKSTENQTFVLR